MTSHSDVNKRIIIKLRNIDVVYVQLSINECDLYFYLTSQLGRDSTTFMVQFIIKHYLTSPLSVHQMKEFLFDV